MLRSSILVVLAVMPIAAFAHKNPDHTICYDYFLNKDGCVYGSATDPCPDKNSCTKKKCESGSVFQHPTTQHPTQAHLAPATKLVRRLDTTGPVYYVDGGEGTCGEYNTTSQIGVCIWNGLTSGGERENAGWLNGGFPDNCHKEVYIQRQGDESSVQYATILDSCNFDNTTDPAVGCFQIYVTKALFDLFNPTEEEINAGALSTITWDFNNPPKSGKYQNAPV